MTKNTTKRAKAEPLQFTEEVGEAPPRTTRGGSINGALALAIRGLAPGRYLRIADPPKNWRYVITRSARMAERECDAYRALDGGVVVRLASEGASAGESPARRAGKPPGPAADSLEDDVLQAFAGQSAMHYKPVYWIADRLGRRESEVQTAVESLVSEGALILRGADGVRPSPAGEARIARLPGGGGP